MSWGQPQRTESKGRGTARGSGGQEQSASAEMPWIGGEAQGVEGKGMDRGLRLGKNEQTAVSQRQNIRQKGKVRTKGTEGRGRGQRSEANGQMAAGSGRSADGNGTGWVGSGDKGRRQGQRGVV